MDYVVGSVAALVSGNVTPNRPRVLKKATTPVKHQTSPNVTPKSELIHDRSIFLSPSVQKKKAIVKKSPKRIFQAPELDVTDENIQKSPKADKVKKHLTNDLETSETVGKKRKITSDSVSEDITMEDSNKNGSSEQNSEITSNGLSSPKKSKKKNKNKSNNSSVLTEEKPQESQVQESGKKNKKQSLNNTNIELAVKTESQARNNLTPSKNNKKNKIKELLALNKSTNEDTPDEKVNKQVELVKEDKTLTNTTQSNSKKKNKRKNKKNSVTESQDSTEPQTEPTVYNDEPKKKKSKKNKTKEEGTVNPNAITEKDSDSEHESDNEIHSETEEQNNEVFNETVNPESSDDEEEEEPAKGKKGKPEPKEQDPELTADEVKRTLFVGNVLFSKKCKKEIKKIFLKHGAIESVRIRTIPVKDARTTPKLAVIKNELHPNRSTVNVYIKFENEDSVEKALKENNTELNGCHLRVTRSATSGDTNDPRNSIFVGNLPFAIEDETLRAKFENCGEITSVRVIRDRKTNAGKGFGYVNFTSKDAVELALSMSEEDLTIKNRILRVKRCLQVGNRPKKQEVKQTDGQTQEKTGAFRRIMSKRKFNDNSNEGPPQKRSNFNQPHAKDNKDKKQRKEFVGMTSEKKKKRSFNPNQKRNKKISEILTKNKNKKSA